MKHVYPTDEIAHLWAHKTQDNKLQAIILEANNYCEFMGLKRGFSSPDSIEAVRSHLVAEQTRMEAKRKRDAARRAKANRLAAIKLRAELAPQVAAWIAGETRFEDRPITQLWRLPEAYMRLELGNDGEYDVKFANEVVTSQGVRVPVSHVRKAWKLVQALYARGEGYQRNGHTIHVGKYALDSVDAQTGEVIAGCHHFERSEIERFGAILDGLTLPVEPEVNTDVQS